MYRINIDKNTQEYLRLLQKKAATLCCTFFLDASAENKPRIDNIPSYTTWGWLIPHSKASSFEESWRKWQVDLKYDNYYCCVSSTLCDGSIDFTFDFFSEHAHITTKQQYWITHQTKLKEDLILLSVDKVFMHTEQNINYVKIGNETFPTILPYDMPQSIGILIASDTDFRGERLTFVNEMDTKL